MSKVVTIAPATGYTGQDQHALARVVHETAHEIGKGDFGDVRNVVIVIETTDGQLEKRVYGETIDRARLIGLLQATAIKEMLSCDRCA